MNTVPCRLFHALSSVTRIGITSLVRKHLGSGNEGSSDALKGHRVLWKLFHPDDLNYDDEFRSDLGHKWRYIIRVTYASTHQPTQHWLTGETLTDAISIMFMSHKARHSWRWKLFIICLETRVLWKICQVGLYVMKHLYRNDRSLPSQLPVPSNCWDMMYFILPLIKTARGLFSF